MSSESRDISCYSSPKKFRDSSTALGMTKRAPSGDEPAFWWRLRHPRSDADRKRLPSHPPSLGYGVAGRDGPTIATKGRTNSVRNLQKKWQRPPRITGHKSQPANTFPRAQATVATKLDCRCTTGSFQPGLLRNCGAVSSLTHAD